MRFVTYKYEGWSRNNRTIKIFFVCILQPYFHSKIFDSYGNHCRCTCIFMSRRCQPLFSVVMATNVKRGSCHSFLKCLTYYMNYNPFQTIFTKLCKYSFTSHQNNTFCLFFVRWKHVKLVVETRHPREIFETNVIINFCPREVERYHVIRVQRYKYNIYMYDK